MHAPAGETHYTGMSDYDDEELDDLCASLDAVDEYVDRLCTPEYLERKLQEIMAAVARDRARAAAARVWRLPTYVAGPLAPCSRN